MKWFRFYNDATGDSKLKLLAFEDRWHYVAVLCMKSSGLLDTKKDELRERRIAAELGLTVRESDEVKRRLMEVSLVTETWQPTGWKKRQYEHDTSAERTRKYRERLKKGERHSDEVVTSQKRHSDVTVTSTDTDTDTDTDTESNRGNRKRFSPPTLDEVMAYSKERGSSVDCQRFHDFYESKGWMIGKNRMKDWKAAFRNWDSKEKPRDDVAGGAI